MSRQKKRTGLFHRVPSGDAPVAKNNEPPCFQQLKKNVPVVKKNESPSFSVPAGFSAAQKRRDYWNWKG